MTVVKFLGRIAVDLDRFNVGDVDVEETVDFGTCATGITASNSEGGDE